jgi:mannosyltransferase OCH1-like enzyme
MRIRPRAVRKAILFVLPFLIALVVLTSRFLAFHHLFFQHPGITLAQRQAVDDFNLARAAGIARPQLIPKIIHQVFHNWQQPGNDTLPEDWAKVRQTCIDLNPDFENRLWTEAASREFIAREYPWFLRTYNGYRLPVQRVDAVRYFILLHYGGVYLDLDNVCHLPPQYSLTS